MSVRDAMARLSAALRSTSDRNFVVVPAVVLAEQALSRRRIHPLWGVPAVWGYMQYRLCGTYRTARGKGGPGMSNPPSALVTSGPYALTRNPMYMGHIVFLTSLTLATRSPVALAYAAYSLQWFDRRAAADEERLAELFGDEYERYRHGVARWLPAPRPGSR